MMITLWRIMVAGCRNFFRNAWLSTAATAVMTVTLVVILSSYILNSALATSIKTVVNRIDVSIFITDGVTEEQRQKLQDELGALENVSEVKFISKAEALERFKNQNRNNQDVVKAIEENNLSLPASFQVKAKDPSNLDPITQYVNREDIKPLIAKYSYEEEKKTVIDRIVQWSRFFSRAGLVASIIFVTISVLIIFNTIRMALYTRRSEIEIMKLVGATNWFIRGPFIFEAALYGIIAAALAMGICYSALLVSGGRLASFIDVGSTIAFFKDNPALILLSQLAIGIMIGATSSLLAITRYLKL